MFVLGFLYWMYDRDLESTKRFLEEKFGKKPEVFDSNIKALQAGYNFMTPPNYFHKIYCC